MKEDVKVQWLDALRSGEYAQGKFALSSQAGFCCLGVLCDLAAKAGVVQWDDDNRAIVLPGDDYEAMVLPPAVIEWAGVEDEYAKDDLGLADKNDNDYTFSQIADIIEKEL